MLENGDLTVAVEAELQSRMESSGEPILVELETTIAQVNQAGLVSGIIRHTSMISTLTSDLGISAAKRPPCIDVKLYM